MFDSDKAVIYFILIIACMVHAGLSGFLSAIEQIGLAAFTGTMTGIYFVMIAGLAYRIFEKKGGMEPMGDTIDALKWALTTRPNWKGFDKVINLANPPVKHASTLLIGYGLLLWFAIAFVVNLLTEAGILSIGVMALGYLWFARASFRLQSRWIVENHEIIKKRIDELRSINEPREV